MNTLGICIGLNFLETFLFYYLLFGTVIDRKTLKTKDKWILYFVLIVTSTIISVWVKRSVFSAYGYLLTILILVLGSFLAYRKQLILLTGIASMYEAAMMLFLYIIYYLLAFIYGNQAENPQILFFRYHENEVFCVIQSLLLIISFFIIFKMISMRLLEKRFLNPFFSFSARKKIFRPHFLFSFRKGNEFCDPILFFLYSEKEKNRVAPRRKERDDQRNFRMLLWTLHRPEPCSGLAA